MIGPDRLTPGLPWGWWLRINGRFLEDDEGRQWHSVRDAFWRGELAFPPSSADREQQELLLRSLASKNPRRSSRAEGADELFDGSSMAWCFYQCWLASVGLVDLTNSNSPFFAPLSAKGGAVLLMLQATRQPEWEGVPFSEIVDDIVAAARGSDEVARERKLNAFERSLGFRRHTFSRERIGPTFLVTLTGMTRDARMPTRRVAWSQSFSNARARDDLYAWLAARVDCWDAWGEMAYQHGADAFASHLFALVVDDGGLVI